MIPDEFRDFFLATAGASGALVGLLFVAVSVAPHTVVGPSATVLHQVRASSAMTALLTPLILALIALIPGANIGWAAASVGAAGLLYVAATLRRLLGAEEAWRARLRSFSVVLGFLIVMVLNLDAGIRLLVSPHSDGAVTMVTGALVASLAIGVSRAWELVGVRQATVHSAVSDLLHGGRPSS